MTNLAKFLHAMAEGIGEQFDSLEAREGESRESLALRDYFSQLVAVAEAVGPEESIDWRSLDQRVGIDLEPDPREGFEALSADSVEVGEAIALDADGVPDRSRPPRLVSEARQSGVTVYLEFADGKPGESFAFEEVVWRRLPHTGERQAVSAAGLIDYLQQFPTAARVVLRGSEASEGELALDVALEQFSSGDYEA